jgi:hypothetical protein
MCNKNEAKNTVIRKTTRPPTARCNLPMYMGYVLTEPKSANCNKMAETVKISHDSINRFLLREAFEPKDLYNEAKPYINLIGGTLSVDDSVLDKPYSHKMALVGHFWSGKHHRTVKGINLITLYYTDVTGQHLPVSYRVYDKEEGKSKNDYFQEMLAEVLAWGLKPAFVTGDSWFSGVKNFKAAKNSGLNSMFALKSNRCVAIEKGKWQPIQKLEIPDEGLEVWLRGVGQVKVFRQRLKDELRHYAIHLTDAAQLSDIDRKVFTEQHDRHWKIEQYHRVIKQVCNIEHFQVRSKIAILNHIFAAICGYVHLQKLCATDVIANCYRLQRELFQEVIASFIKEFVVDKTHLNPQFCKAVNA